MRTTDDFCRALLDVKKHPEPGYGGKVLPAIELYPLLSSRQEVSAYRDALLSLLNSRDQEVREFAVDVCLGFFTFYDVIARPKLTDG